MLRPSVHHAVPDRIRLRQPLLLHGLDGRPHRRFVIARTLHRVGEKACLALRVEAKERELQGRRAAVQTKNDGF
jgi:hypothetical protein